MSNRAGLPGLMQMARRAVLGLGCVLAWLVPAAHAQQPQAAAPAAAQTQEQGVPAANYLNPFPENDTWRALVIGDALGEGLLGGLIEAFNGEPRLQFQRKHKTVGSLVRTDIEEDLRGIEEAIGRERVHMAVVMLGLNDRGGMRTSTGRRAPVGSDEWRALYGARIDRIIKLLRRKSIAVYWVGLPIMRRQDVNDDSEVMNEVFRDRAGSNGARYIEVFAQTADEGGGFTDRGPDVTGKPARLRDPDGVLFTPAGYRKLAFFLERDLKRDMVTARNERTIPLAGNETEQKKVNPGAAAAVQLAAQAATLPGAPQAKGGKSVPLPTARTAPQALAAGTTLIPTPPAEGQPGDQRADNARIAFKVLAAGGREEQVTVDILRPALPASVIALITRRESGDKASQLGETLTDTLSNGLMIMRSVTPSADAAARGTRAAPTQQPFFRALVKGERLTPKPGRADDFRWPREDDLPPPPEADAGRGSAPISSPVQLKQVPPKGAPRPGRS